MFSSRVNRSRRAYRDFVEEGKGEGHQERYGRESETDSRVLGDEDFIDRVVGQSKERSKRRVTVEKIISHVCKQFSLKEQIMLGPGKDRRLSKVRAIAAWFVLDSGYLTLTELSKHVDRDPSTLSSGANGAKYLERQIKTDVQTARLISKIREDLYEIPLSQAQI
jgi:chromosomal replication initiation ATPase DnaA